MSWSIYPTLARFFIATGTIGQTQMCQLNELCGIDLNAALEGASPAQREIVLAAIQFHLRTPGDPDANGMYLTYRTPGIYISNYSARRLEVQENTIEEQRTKFDALELTGVTFEEVIAAPRLMLNTIGSTRNSIFEGNTFFNGLLLGSMCFVSDVAGGSSNFLLEGVTSTGPYLQREERAFLATVLLNEPELILNIRQHGNTIFQEITLQHITTALDTVVQDPWAAARFLTSLERMQDPTRNINATVIATVLSGLNDQHIIQALHTVAQDPQAISYLSSYPAVIATIAIELFGESMDAAGLNNAIYHEVATHTREIGDDLLELGIAVVRVHCPYLVTEPLRIGPIDADVHRDIGVFIFNTLNAHDMLQVIRASYLTESQLNSEQQQEQDAQIALAINMGYIGLLPEPDFSALILS